MKTVASHPGKKGSWTPHARALLGALAFSLACDGRDCSRSAGDFLDNLVRLAVVFAVLAVAQVVVFVLFIVGFVKLAKDEPSMGWGITALVAGVLFEVALLLVMLRFGGANLWAGNLFNLPILYVGVRHLQLARRATAAPPDSSAGG